MKTFIFNILLIVHLTYAQTILELIKTRPEISKFTNAIESSEVAKLLLKFRSYTIFVPTDEAMSKHKGKTDESFVRYHLINRPFKIQDLPNEVGTDLEGNPSLYVARFASGKRPVNGWENEDIFINNAKVLEANILTRSSKNQPQYIHVIDRVLEPTVAQIQDDLLQYSNPDALKVLENPKVYGFKDNYGLRNLFDRVVDLKANGSFSRGGKNTFFLPVDKAFEINLRNNDKNLYDRKVVQGHIIPNQVVFTRMARDPLQQYQSLAYNGDLKAVISLSNVTDSSTKETTFYVSSNIIEGDPKHAKGTAIARIIKGNIPVKNGVLHLLDRPLMLVATNIISYLQDPKGQLIKFNKLLGEHYPDLLNMLMTTENDITVFAPSNSAFQLVDEEKYNRILLNKQKIDEILKMHVINRRLMTDEIVDRSLQQAFQEDTLATQRKLYFAVSGHSDPVPRVSIEGAGVNATITVPNLVSKNGVIHVIDRILGIPSQTVYEKLATDPMLSSSFFLSNQGGWNKRLNNKDEGFTFFVPSNEAWESIEKNMPSYHKKLFSGKYKSHGTNILERHLIVRKPSLYLDELRELTTNGTPEDLPNKRKHELQMMRGKIYFQARVRKNFGGPGTIEEYYVEWQGLTAKVIRPNLECTNGVVHVIEKVLMSKNDVTVNGGRMINIGVIGSFLILINALLVLRI